MLNQLDIYPLRKKYDPYSTQYTKINSMCIVKKTHQKQNKASKRQQGNHFNDLSIGNYFSNKTQKAQTTKKTSDKLNHLPVKLRTSFIKDLIKRMKKSPINMRKYTCISYS